ncbi:amidase, partial [Bhargavaea cecembensis]|uniref:amidase n=1 Tax=Bhargavaea cecembensis TaxID=394098 RepID=UPI0005915546
MTLFDKSAKELQSLIHKKELSAAELTAESYRRIKAVDGDVKAFLALDEERATARAEELDRTPMEARGPLHGLPVGVKDNIVTEGLETTCASRMLGGFDPIYNATAATKLDQAGLITVGKVNMDEFAMGGSTENSFYKKTANPWNLEYVPGGSSGGSAAAVAAGEVPFTL